MKFLLFILAQKRKFQKNIDKLSVSMFSNSKFAFETEPKQKLYNYSKSFMHEISHLSNWKMHNFNLFLESFRKIQKFSTHLFSSFEQKYLL